jgi:NosR/NirI family nitrous oxide reductase transcriptional regulator
LIPISQQEELSRIVLLKNAETKKIIDFLEHKDFYNSWLTVPLDTNALNLNIDAVSGATITSNAIIKGVNNTLASYLDIQSQQKSDWTKIVQLISVLLIIILAIVMLLTRRFKRFYYFHLAAVLLVLGVWTRKMLSVDLLYNWLKNGLPWYNNAELIVILLISITMALLGRKKFYCNYICPMGALQMLTSKLSPFKKRQLPRKILKVDIRNLYLSFVWASLLCGLTLPLSTIEPFMAFVYELAGWFLIVFGVLIVVLSLFFNRPWCNFCPTGCALDAVSPVKINHNEK